MPAPPVWHIHLFGVLQLTSGDRTITRFRTQMTGSLLAYLAYQGGRPQPREVLIEQFWPAVGPKSGRGRLSVALSSLRAQLSPVGSGMDLLLADRFTVALNPLLFETDVAAFLKALERARHASSPSERSALLEEATRYYRDDFLIGSFDPWVLPEQERLREQFRKATAERVRLREQVGTDRGALPVAHRIEQDKPPATAEPVTIPLPPASPGISTALASGTYTVLLAEGEAAALAAFRASAMEKGGTPLPAPEGEICFLFGNGYTAVAAAVAGMRGTQEELRVALDTGFIEVTAGDGDGVPLRTLSRLITATHRGQVLCTEVTAALAFRNLADTSTTSQHRLRDLGRFRLTEAGVPERLFQAEASDQAPVLFSPPRAALGDTPVLPPAYTRFFGRENEVVRLLDLFIENGVVRASTNLLVTLTGIGGIGKTRLALEVATQAQQAFAGRVWFAALADLRDATLVPDALRDALHLPKDPALDPLEQCAAFLAAAPSLLVLDNMEPFVAHGEATVFLRALRIRASSLACLVTSRQLVGIEGERAFPVGPLLHPLPTPNVPGIPDTPPAEDACVLLFTDRAQAVRPDFAVTTANRDSIVHLCAVLEGIPLAIELAAARAALFSTTQLLAQVENRFDLLQSRKRNLPERHRSLWAAVDSSYQLLPPALQRFFARLSVFRGGWTLASAQAVCAPESSRFGKGNEAATMEAVAELQEYSLLWAAEGAGNMPRFQMLDTLREFATEQLREQGDEAETQQRYRDFFTALTADAEPHLSSGGSTQQRFLDQLEADHDNLRAILNDTSAPLQALQTGIALHRFWLMRGYSVEGRQRLSRLLAATSDAPDTVRAKAHNALGILTWSMGALKEAREHLMEALEHYRACAEPDSVARALNNLGIVASQNGSFAEARAFYEESLSLYRVLGDPLRQSMVLTNLGGVLVYLKDYGAARRVLEESLPIQRAAGDNFSLVRTLQNLTEVAVRQNDENATAAFLQESILLRRTLGDRSTFSDTLATTAEVLTAWGKAREAAILWGALEAARTSSGTTPTPANADYEKDQLSQIRQLLSGEAFTAAHQEGRTMDFDQALDFAEQQLRR